MKAPICCFGRRVAGKAQHHFFWLALPEPERASSERFQVEIAEAKRLEVALEPRLAVFQGVKWADGEPKLVEFSNGWKDHLHKLRGSGIKVAEGKDPRELRLQDAV